MKNRMNMNVHEEIFFLPDSLPVRTSSMRLFTEYHRQKPARDPCFYGCPFLSFLPLLSYELFLHSFSHPRRRNRLRGFSRRRSDELRFCIQQPDCKHLECLAHL
jgi:hypothetical protein